MSVRLFVGNIPHASNEKDVEQLISQAGYRINFVQIIRDRVTGHSRGFGFVEVETERSPLEVVKNFQNTKLNGRLLTINLATPKGTGSLGRTA